MRIGLIARSDNSGLGNQTRELAYMLNPDKILLIDSTPFNQNTQNPEWYKEYIVTKNVGFVRDKTALEFLKNLDVVISCEIFYNKKFPMLAKQSGVKTVLQYNYEFLDNLQNPDLPLPDVLLSPSKWNIEDVMSKFGKSCSVIHLPPPTNHSLFENAREINLKPTKKLLHIAGKIAVMDRNGTDTVIEMMKYSKEDFALEIRSQVKLDYEIKDDRIKIISDNIKDQEDLYSGYDAMVLPRRYAGLCLPMNEALLSGLPVFMTDVSPNNQVLPSEWLVASYKTDQLMTRTMLDVYSADPEQLAAKIDSYMSGDKTEAKNKAFEIGYSNFSRETLKQNYLDLLSF
jgi:glycosyltransferase involved in cell wall biosynthesis